MDLLFRCRALLHISRDERLNLGRNRPVPSWDNVLISRNHVQLHLREDGAALELSCPGRNAVVIERQAQEGGSWDVVAVVDPGGSTLLPLDSITASHATRFFVMGAREDSAVELRPAAVAPTAEPNMDGPAAKRPRMDTVAMLATTAAVATPAAPTGAATTIAASSTAASAHERREGAACVSVASFRASQLQAASPSATALPGTAPSNGATNRVSAAPRTAATPTAGDYDVGSPIHLLRVRGLSPRFNSGCMGVHFQRLVSGSLQLALVSNYMVDMGWLLSCCPDLALARQFFVVHGEQADSEPEMRQQAAAAGARHVQLYRPPLPILYGTHHSKAFLLTYPAGLRLIIHTANCVSPDCNEKSQGVWVQDFPRKQGAAAEAPAASAGPSGEGRASSAVAASPGPAQSDFERDLVAYFCALALPAAMAGPVLQAIAEHDFSFARGALVSSVPGYHRGAAAVQSYGHMRLRRLLEQVPLPAGFQGSGDGGAPAAAAVSTAGAGESEGLVIQCSSMGSFDQAWLVDEMGVSLAVHRRPPPPRQGQRQQQLASPPGPSRPPGCGALPLAVVWPTVEEVRNSLEGWNAGRSIPGPARNVTKPFMGRHYACWGGEAVGRQRAMPHIKTYTR